MTKEALLADLRETYIALKPSPVHGIGVFAIRDIPKGCREMFSKENGEWMKVPITEVDALPEPSRDLVETYCVFDTDHYWVPTHGFKKVDLVNFLNHSDTPNVVSLNDGEIFEALTDIPHGQELFINYKEIVDVTGY
jgi:SET domain-containing protein